METFACIILLLSFFAIVIVAILDVFQVQKLRRREDLRRETIKNTLQDICLKLDDISKGIWYEK